MRTLYLSGRPVSTVSVQGRKDHAKRTVDRYSSLGEFSDRPELSQTKRSN